MSEDDPLHKVFPSTTRRETGVYVVTSFCVIGSIVILVGLIKLLKKRDFPFIKKRHPALVLVTVLCSILSILIERPLSGFARLSDFTSIELQWFRYIFQVIVAQTLLYSVLCRIYITYFDVSFTKANAKTLWLKHIDVNSKCETSWMVENYQKWGNLYKIYPHIIAIIVFSISITIILSIINFTAGFICNAVVWLLVNISMFIIWTRTPKFLDHFKIRGLFIIINQ